MAVLVCEADDLSPWATPTLIDLQYSDLGNNMTLPPDAFGGLSTLVEM